MLYFVFLILIFTKYKDPCASQGCGLPCHMSVRKDKKNEVCGVNAGRIMVNYRLEEVKIVVTWKTSCRETVPQSSTFWKEAALVFIIGRQWGMEMIHSCGTGIVPLSSKDSK